MEIEKLKESAKKCYSQGLNIIPTWQKAPTILWNELQNRRQTEKEFNNLSIITVLRE